MKLAAISLSILAFSYAPIPEAPPENVFGFWKGYFGTENEIHEISIRIDQRNRAEIVCYYPGTSIKTIGTYQLLGDSSIIITCLLAQSKSCEVVLYGNLNRSANFIDGQWDGSDKEGGCFYLQKMSFVPNP